MTGFMLSSKILKWGWIRLFLLKICKLFMGTTIETHLNSERKLL